MYAQDDDECSIASDDFAPQHRTGGKPSYGRRQYYPTNGQQKRIRNAMTGELYPWRVGTLDSLRLFKMVDATGTCSADGYKILTRQLLPNPAPNHLFYNSPEEYMQHQRMSLPGAYIASWRAKHVARFLLQDRPAK